MTTEPRRSIMRARAASMAPRAASPCTADGVARDAVDAASSLGGHRANVPRPLPDTPGLLELQRCGLGGDAHPFTPSTRHVTNSASSPTSAEPRRVTQAPRDRFGSACASSSLGPWSDDPSTSVGGGESTLASAGDQGGSTTGSCTRAFPFASEGASRVDTITGFFVTPCKYGEFAKKQLCAPPIRYPKRRCRSPR